MSDVQEWVRFHMMMRRPQRERLSALSKRTGNTESALVRMALDLLFDREDRKCRE